MSKKWIWIVCIVSGLILVVAVFSFVKYYQQQEKDNKSNSNINANANTNSISNVNANTNAKVSNGNTNAAPDPYLGWVTYTNSKHNYTIKYPAGGTTSLEDTGVANDDVCVKISTEYIYAIIGIGTQDEKTMCLRTGVGNEWSNTSPLSVTILGKAYSFSGMISQSASAGNHDEFYSGSLDSGEGINMGVSVNEKYDTKGTKFADQKAEMIKMIQSFQHIK